MVDEVVKMSNKKLTVGILGGVIVLSALGYLYLNPEEEVQVQVVEEKPSSEPAPVVNVVSKPVVQPPVKKTDLTFDEKIPFSAISDLSVLPPSVRKTLLSEEVYYLHTTPDKAIVIKAKDNNEIRRHNFDLIEISLEDGNILNKSLEETDSKYDKWKYDNDLPMSHTRYNDDKEIVFTEVWNYSEDEPIKYKKTDKDGNVISVRKEVVENNVNLREDNLFYDSEGNMVKNISFNYDGTDLTRFTYYNSDTPDESAMLVSEFEDGVKKKETLYSTDYKVKNVYLPEYQDGQMSKLKVLDKDNKVVETLVGEALTNPSK